VISGGGDERAGGGFFETAAGGMENPQGFGAGKAAAENAKAVVRAEDKQGGGEGVGGETVVGKDGDAGDGVAGGDGGARVDDV
jgi:hypothetical protein